MTAAETPTLEPVHDFAGKLLQPGMRPAVVQYIRWRQAVRAARVAGMPAPAAPRIGPLSINLDLTTACNYACDHCIDWDSLNSPVRHDDAGLRASIEELASRGLRSVILIGGGEPTVYPGFGDMVRFLKGLDLQVAVVTNGSRNESIEAVADCLTAGDWVRLSLDSGTDATFQAMHKPKTPGITLAGICESAARIKQAQPAVDLGFSYVITWQTCQRDDVALVENLHEMEAATQLAKQHGFDYISFKPYLLRAPSGAEVLDAAAVESQHQVVLERIRAGLAAARRHATGQFRVVESTNLRVLLGGTWQNYTQQPRECHMQALRQVLSPLGTYNCPAHRGVSKARIGGKNAWATPAPEAASGTARILDDFDASIECAAVTCLYNPVNRFLEAAVASGADPEESLEALADRGDAFL